MDTIPTYWLEVEDLTIFDAAYWMQIGGDPRCHDYRCEYENDDSYERYFHDHPGGYEAVCERCEVVLSAIRVGLIKVTDEVRGGDQELSFRRTRILKSDWIQWCRRNANPELDLLAYQFDGGRAFDHDGDQSKTEANQSMTSEPDIAIITEAVALGDVSIPGNQPKVSVGRLAIKAAWDIERSTGHAATTKEVMNQLQDWADAGSRPDVLLKSDRKNRSVYWRTSKSASKPYSSEACEKALAAWHKSRA